MDSDKRGFLDKKSAEEELKRIIETQNRPWAERDRKPCRAYFSNKTKMWHLTSKKLITEFK